MQILTPIFMLFNLKIFCVCMNIDGNHVGSFDENARNITIFPQMLVRGIDTSFKHQTRDNTLKLRNVFVISNVKRLPSFSNEGICIERQYQLELDINENFTFTTKNLRPKFTLKDVYTLRQQTPDKYSLLKELKGKDGNKNSRSFDNTNPLQGIHFRVASAYSSPSVTHIEDNCRGNKCFQGMFADIWDELSKDLNFTYTVRKMKQFGSCINGNWNGMIGSLKKNEADIAVAGLTITKDRSDVVDFLPSLLEVDEKLFLNTPNDSMYLYAYGKPFTFYSWLGVTMLILVSPIVLAGTVYFSQRTCPEDYELGHCYWYVIETLMTNVSMGIPKANCSRIAFLSVLIGGLVIHYYWEAMLISYLATRKTELPFTTLSEMVENGNYRLIIAKDTAHLDRIRYSKRASHVKIWKEQIEPRVDELPSYTNLVEILLENSNNVIYEELNIMQHDAYRNCLIMDTGKPIYTSQLAWAVQKNSPLYPILRDRLQRLKEIGTVQRYNMRYKPRAQVCPDYSGKPITIKQCIAPFFVLVTGFIASIIWLIIEISLPRQWMERLLGLGNNIFKSLFIRPFQ